jgi:hypothetical protein
VSLNPPHLQCVLEDQQTSLDRFDRTRVFFGVDMCLQFITLIGHSSNCSSFFSPVLFA